MLNNIRLKPELCVREKIDMSDKVSKSASRPAKRRQTRGMLRQASVSSRQSCEVDVFVLLSLNVYLLLSFSMDEIIVIIFIRRRCELN